MNEKERKKRLVFFDFITHFGGAQCCTVLLLERLKQTEEVHVIDAYGCCTEYMDALAKYNILTHILSPDVKKSYIGYEGKSLKRIWSFIGQIPALLILRHRLIKKILEINPDLIWTNSVKALAFLITGLRLRQYTMAIYAHGWYRKFQVPGFGRWLIKRFVDCVLAVSNPTKAALKSWGVSEDKIHVVFNTIDFDNILEDGSKEPITEVPGIHKGYKILVPGTLLRTKGQHSVVKAAYILKKKGFDFAIWLVGGVSAGDESGYREHLLQQIGANGLQDNVFLLGWRSDVLSLMNLSDVVVLPTHTEGLPRVIQEAMILLRHLLEG